MPSQRMGFNINTELEGGLIHEVVNFNWNEKTNVHGRRAKITAAVGAEEGASLRLMWRGLTL